MKTRSAPEGSNRDRTIIAAALLGLMTTAVVLLISQIRFAYQNPELHLVLETAEGMIALLTAYLMWGRYTRSRNVSEVVLVFGLAVLGLSNLVFSVLPDLLGVGPREIVRTWAPVTTRFVGGIAFALAAILPRRELPETRRALQILLTALAGTFGAVILATKGFDGSLPHLIESELTAEASNRPDLSANPTFTVIQAMLFVPYAVASLGFLNRFRRTGDDLMGWFAAGTVLSAFARIQYALYPSLYSDFFYSGDILRLGFYMLLLVGATREMRTHWRGLALASVLEERRRLAQDLHDGIAQEMTFLAGQVTRLGRPNASSDPELLRRVTSATERAVAETRRAISAVGGEIHESLGSVLRETALQIFPTDSPSLELELEMGIEVAPRYRERIIRVAREALTNAARHADASKVALTLAKEGDRIVVTIQDDGLGFDPEADLPGFGLVSMTERVRNLGGEFRMESITGRGTTVEMSFRD